MIPNSDTFKRPRVRRNIVFIGETGAGKSSAINLLLKTGTPASVSNDSQPCTQTSTHYETMFNDAEYILWDTRGLGEGRGFLRILFGGNAEKDLRSLLKERHCRHEIDLLVYCIRGSRATEASRNYYKKFCTITRRLAAPVAIVVTYLEKEKDMDDWWSRNSGRLEELEMEFDDHVCITALAGHPRLAESRRKLIEMISKSRRWEAEDSGSYFGSPVPRLTPTSTPQRKGGIWSRMIGATGKASVDVEALAHRSSNLQGRFAPSITDSSYHTANSPAESTLPSPVVEPPTPRSIATSIKVPHINTNLLTSRASDRLQAPSEEVSSSGSSSQSMFQPGSFSSCTSHSDAYLESCTEENEDSPGELTFRLSTTAVRRRKGWASRSGGFGDVWECDLILGEISRMVAVKAVRFNTNGNGVEDMKSYEKKLRRELRIWVKLRHKNIVPLLGVVSGFGPLPSAVSPWFRNGSLSWHLAHHQTLKSEKHRLLGDIAVGLRYLHNQGVIHGDLHSDNVLIDDDGTACITDFGLSFISDFVGTSYLKSGICGGVHFADPALFKRAYTSQDNVFYPTKPCDIYSFGGLILHVLSGKKPYEGIPSPVLIVTVIKGERPQIPNQDNHVSPWHKSLIRLCWNSDERKRPLADDLVRRFDRQ